MATIIEHEVEKSFLDRATIKKRFVKQAEAVEEEDIKVENVVSTITIETIRSLSPTLIYLTTKKLTRRRTLLQPLQMCWIPIFNIHIPRKGGASVPVLAAINIAQHDRGKSD